MKPVYRITADGQAVDLSGLLISLEIQDGDGGESDTLTLAVDNSEGKIEKPRRGVKLQVWIGYEEEALVDKGVFTVNEVSDAWPVRVLEIHAPASDFTTESPIKLPKTRSWPEISIGDLVSTVAKENNLEAAVSSKFGAMVVPHYDQTESDIQMLSTLAFERGALCKTSGNKLLFVAQDEATSASGKTLPGRKLTPADISTAKVAFKDRSECTGVRTHWHETESAALHDELAGDETGPVFNIASPYSSQGEARAAAKAKLEELWRGTRELNVTMPGDAALSAETPLTLDQFDGDVDGDWTIKSITHSLSDSGYTCSFSAT